MRSHEAWPTEEAHEPTAAVRHSPRRCRGPGAVWAVQVHAGVLPALPGAVAGAEHDLPQLQALLAHQQEQQPGLSLAGVGRAGAGAAGAAAGGGGAA